MIKKTILAQFLLLSASCVGVPTLEDNAVDGNAEAQAVLGLRYAIGEGVTKDGSEAVRWIRLAADQGQPEAQFTLGMLHYWGRWVDKDGDEAVKWVRLAYENGQLEAQAMLGVAYVGGVDVSEDIEKGTRLLRLAAEQGSDTAQYWLYHVVSDDNPEQGVNLLRSAAEQGHPPAQMMLGLSYMDADGELRDPIKAFAWLSVSQGKAQVSDPSTALGIGLAVSGLVNSMTPDQIAEAEELAGEISQRIAENKKRKTDQQTMAQNLLRKFWEQAGEAATEE